MAVDGLELTVEGEIWLWRGPSPFHFVTVPEESTAAIRVVAPLVSYGWGMVPVRARIGDTAWTTAMFPKDGRYVVPVKDAVRRAEELAAGDAVILELAIGR
jgi:hypothetical protein